MIRKNKFVEGQYYHVFNRIILRIPEFRNPKIAARFVQALLLANSTKSSEAFSYLRNTDHAVFEKALEIVKKGKKLVDVVCYVVMGDHYHLLLRELVENGITNFLRKCDTSIAKYVNISKERRGPLFEGCFKAKLVDSNEYLIHLSAYIHLNPLDFIDGPNWRFHRIKNWPLKREKLLKYPWSSLKSFLDNNHEDNILSGTEIILGQFSKRQDYENYLREWSACDAQDLGKIEEVEF